MGFTVYRPGGITELLFEKYARLLRQTKNDLGKLPRVPEPGIGRHWLRYWNTREEAQAFADEMKKRMGSPGWEVAEVEGPPSEGPLGPVRIEMLRQGDGVTFAVPPLSQAVIDSAFPEAFSSATQVFLDRNKWDAVLRRRGGWVSLIPHLAPILTGLTLEQLESVGYAVRDVVDDVLAFEVLPPQLRRAVA